MKPSPFNNKTAILVAFAGLLCSWWIWSRNEIHFRVNESTLRNVRIQLSQSTGQRDLFSNRPAKEGRIAQDPRLDLEQLRAERKKLKTDIDQLQSALKQRPRWGTSRLAEYSPPYTNSPEQMARADEITEGKKQDIGKLHTSLSRYIADHHGQFPQTIDELDSYLLQDNMTLTGTNQFDLVYSGTLDELTNFPLRSIAIFREQQAWLAPNGAWTRIYGMNGGPTGYGNHWQIVSSDDDFAAFEGEHVVSPPYNSVGP
jgi:hypothetical protein